MTRIERIVMLAFCLVFMGLALAGILATRFVP